MSDGTVRLTRAQVREVDRRAIEEFGVPGIVLMENAAINASAVALDMLNYQAANVTIICGGGNNGGDGLAIARHLHNYGLDVRILLTIDPAKYAGDALINWRIVQAMKLPVAPFDAKALGADEPDLLIDAVFGTGLSETPREPFADIAKAMNAAGVPILSIDVPSGLDCDTGQALGTACVKATKTVTFVAEKLGFADPASRAYTGEVVVAGIGCPAETVGAIVSVAKDPGRR
jgi:NAD(P)H-hydrate epimerase